MRIKILVILVVIVTSAIALLSSVWIAGAQTDVNVKTKQKSVKVSWAVNALARINKPPLGLPQVNQPEFNIATVEKIELGRKLFFDRRLSRNNTMSCAMCHIPDQGFGNIELATPIGVEGRSLKRNAPTIFNVAYHRTMFHDGRDTSLETQVFGPFLSEIEMANPSVGWLLETINGLEDYWGRFEKAFGKPANANNLGHALAAYQRSIISANSPFDKWYFGGQKNAMSKDAKKGFELFRGKARCTRCHLLGKTTALFTDHGFHNTGIGFVSDVIRPANKGPVSVEISPGVTVDLPRSNVDAVGEPHQKDIGRMEVTSKPTDLYVFKTPILRNVALTAPYMHDGSMSSLKEVVAFYNKGQKGKLAKTMPALHLTKKQQAELVAFLKSLTGDNVQTLITEANGLSK